MTEANDHTIGFGIEKNAVKTAKIWVCSIIAAQIMCFVLPVALS